ncbi:MAG TPA: zeta toxin family protein [Paracoccaceae bacterium]|nr:zeta toxin family protein [Paracoccaceae bacterium]
MTTLIPGDGPATVEDELALMRRRPPAPPAAAPPPDDPALLETVQGETTVGPPAAAAPAEPAFPPDDPRLPPRETGLPSLPDIGAGWWETGGAAWTEETILTDAWAYTARLRQDLNARMLAALDPEARAALQANAWRYDRDQGLFVSDLTAAVRAAAALSPDDAARLAGLPQSPEGYGQAITATKRAELDAAQAVLDASDSWSAKFAGAAARAVTDEASLMLLPFGLKGGAARVILGEAALGAAAEGLVLPREFETARELDEAEPDALSRIAFGAALGAGLAGGVIGGVALWRRRAERRAALRHATPEGTSTFDAEIAVDEAEAALRGETTASETLAGGPRPSPGPDPGTLGAILDGDAPPPRLPPGTLPPVRPDAPPNWARIRNGIFAGESGGDYNALFGFQNRRGGRFANVRLTEMTVDQAIEFSNPRGAYGQWVARVRPDPENGVATPMGAYQIVGSTLRGLKRDLKLTGDELMTPEFQDYLGQQIYLRQGTGAWVGYRGPRDSFSPAPPDRDAPTFGSSRGYTGTGQVAVGDGRRVDVRYEVVDAADLRRAFGEFQPRDRGRIGSDAWIADTAARLDPALLMPAPTADRGAPLVGPDGMIESGNGRFGAILRAYERHPDRAQAYRDAIEQAGFAIPEGAERPILIARRTTELDDAARRELTVDAQDSGVAVMTPSEAALAYRRALDGPALARLDPAAGLDDAANAAFARGVLARLPRSLRNAMFTDEGALNGFGQKQLSDMIFARAWDDPDIVALFTEASPRDLRGLMDALSDAAPEWAALKADIEAGLVDPAMDISGHVLDAVRMIALARRIAARDRTPLAQVMSGILNDPDLIDGAVAPLTASLLRRFWRNGRVAPADEVADFLIRYARDARQAARAGDMFGAAGPRDVLRAIDPDTFGNLPQDLGPVRGFARPGQDEPAPLPVTPEQGFDAGAQSPEASALHQVIRAELESEGIDSAGTLQRMSEQDPAYRAALQAQAEIAHTTSLEGYGTDAFWQQRIYRDAAGAELIGRDAAADYLRDGARKLGWSEEGLAPGEIRKERRATILVGPPASGKSSIANPLARARGAAIVDADEAKKVIPVYGRGEGAAAVHEESGELTSRVLEGILAGGENVLLPKVGGSAASIGRLTTQLKELGYSVELVEVVTTPREAIARMIARGRATGRFIPPDVMAQGIDGAPNTYQILKEEGLADSYARIDNTPPLGEPRRVIEGDPDIRAAFGGRDGGDRGASDGRDVRPTENARGATGRADANRRHVTPQDIEPSPGLRSGETRAADLDRGLRAGVEPPLPPPAAWRKPPPGDRLDGILSGGGQVSTLMNGLTAAERRWLAAAYKAGDLERRPNIGLAGVMQYRRPQPGSDATWQRAADGATLPAGAARAAADGRAAIDGARIEFDPDMAVPQADGTTVSARAMLEDLDADEAADAALDLCLINPGGAFR